MSAVLIALLCSLLSQAQPRDQPARRDLPPAGAASVSGVVQAAGSATPIQGAVVVLVTAPLIEGHSAGRAVEQPRSDGRSMVTDASGRFTFTGIAPGAYRVIVSPAFFQGRYLPAGHGARRPNDAGRPITIRAGDDIRALTLTVPVGVAIEGRVMDEGGEPLSRMTVVAARLTTGSDDAERVRHDPATTDDLGRYRIYGLEPGEYVVAVEGRSTPVARTQGAGALAPLTEPELMAFLTTYHPSSLVESSAQRIRVSPGRDVMGVDIAAVRARRFRVSGVILDSQGLPAASANGSLSRGGVMGSATHGFTADAQGRFTIAAVEPGDYRLHVGGGMWSTPTGSGGRPETAELPIAVATDFDDLVVVLQPGVGISGRVLYADGPAESAPRLRIVFRRADGSITRSPDIVASIDDQLRFQAADLFGPRTVRVSALPTGWAVKAVMLNGTDVTDIPTVFTRAHDGQLQIVLASRLSTLEGEVRDDAGRAIDDAMVFVFSADRPSWSMTSPRTVISDVRPDGRFTVGGLTGGRYFAIAVARDGFRVPQGAGEKFFDLLSRDATAFVIGDDERRTLDLRVWRWPE